MSVGTYGSVSYQVNPPDVINQTCIKVLGDFTVLESSHLESSLKLFGTLKKYYVYSCFLFLICCRVDIMCRYIS